MKLFITGANGFIGNALIDSILSTTPWGVVAVDVERDRLAHLAGSPRLEFLRGDISAERSWVEAQVERCDVVVPLAAIAVPRAYVDEPLAVFELDFVENLRLVKLAARYGRRLVFPSTSEAYGMAADPEFCEDSTCSVFGPIHKQRWIYGCSKQLLDRVIYAYGQHRGLRYTCFRPFNWVGPHQDRVQASPVGNSRVVPQFIGDILFNRPLTVVDGGEQTRCFLHLDDGIRGLMQILQDDGSRTDSQILNIGDPRGQISILGLAELLIGLYAQTARARSRPFTAGIVFRTRDAHFGGGYEDISARRPSIAKMQQLFDWNPSNELRSTMERTLHWYIHRLDGSPGAEAPGGPYVC
jgi:nucleoside-diphosphate-sugar epimerase